jgi:uncharacterized protein YfaS (alpha-2-macroglobulin family)
LQGQLLLSGKPPLNLARYIRELQAYPYGCLEQTTSGLFPSLYTNAAQLTALGIKGDTMISAVRRLISVSPVCCRCSVKRRLCAVG